jgi:riboflavin kinase/FMN adenylyltransferase
MRLFRHFDEAPDPIKGGAVALGNFDGVHCGHRVVIEAARNEGNRRHAPWGVMSFEPHPRAVLSAPKAPFRLTPMRTKARLIEEMGADFALMQHFDRAFAGISAEEFVNRILVGGLKVSAVVAGHDFVFGKGRQGDVELLTRMAETNGFDVVFVDPVMTAAGTAYSSSIVREALVAGRLDEVVRQLGRPWEIEGHVRRGEARGRELGYPTANVALGELIRPATGVYAVRVEINGSGPWRPGVAYIGSRPTFGGDETFLEAHLFDFSGDLYGKGLRVAMIDYLRPDQRFADAAALAAQMDRDAQSARRRLAVTQDQEASS